MNFDLVHMRKEYVVYKMTNYLKIAGSLVGRRVEEESVCEQDMRVLRAPLYV